jgi:putative tricarboxylic transport membrane protein
MLSRDGWAGLVVLATSLFLFALTLGLKDSPLVPIGPGFYPRIVLGITAVFAACLVMLDFHRSRRPLMAGDAKAGSKPNYAAVAVHFLVFGLYAIALPYLGFRIATFVYVASASALMDPPRSRWQWLRAIVLGLITALVAWLVFERYLSVLMPRGRWTDF